MNLSVFNKQILISLIVFLLLPISLKAEELSFQPLELASSSSYGAEIQPEKYLGWSGLWQQFKENLTLTLTFDNLKKAEKKIIYAEKRLRAGEKLLHQSDQNREKAIKIISQADSYKYDISSNEDSLNKLWQNHEKAEVNNFLENLSTHQVNKAIIWTKVENNVPFSGLEKFNLLRSEADSKDLNFLNKLQENLEGEEVVVEIKKASKILQNFKSLREEFVSSNENLLKKLQKQSDQDVIDFLDNKLEILKEEKETTFASIINSQASDLERQEIKEKIKTELRQVNSPSVSANKETVKGNSLRQEEKHLQNFKSSPEYQKFLQNIDSSWKFKDNNQEDKQLPQ